MTDQPLDLTTLESAAKAATPGPWQNGIEDLEGVVAPKNPGLGNVICIPPLKNMYSSLERWDDNAAFIAVWNPTTALSILARLEAAETEVERLRNPKRDEMIERSEEEWQDFEEGTMLLYSLKPGHVLTEADIKSLTFADDCRRNDDESATDAYHKGREEGLRERGGDELFDLTMRHEKAVADKAVERAMKVFAEARATTAEALAKTLQLQVRRLSSALVDISVRVGTPGEIVNASQRGQAIADVRRMAYAALSKARPDTGEQSQ